MDPQAPLVRLPPEVPLALQNPAALEALVVPLILAVLLVLILPLRLAVPADLLARGVLLVLADLLHPVVLGDLGALLVLRVHLGLADPEVLEARDLPADPVVQGLLGHPYLLLVQVQALRFQDESPPWTTAGCCPSSDSG